MDTIARLDRLGTISAELDDHGNIFKIASRLLKPELVKHMELHETTDILDIVYDLLHVVSIETYKKDRN